MLDKRDPDGAIAAFEEVVGSSLAKADAEVRGRAIEDLGYAYELQAELHPDERDKDLDKAIEQYKQLEATDVLGFKQMAHYHEARCYEPKGDKAKAIELLKGLREELMKRSDGGPPLRRARVADRRPPAPARPDGRAGRARQLSRAASSRPRCSRSSARAPRERVKNSGLRGVPHERSRRRAALVARLTRRPRARRSRGDRVNPETPTWFSRRAGT